VTFEMKRYVLVSVDFRKDLDQVRRRRFSKALKEWNWNRAGGTDWDAGSIVSGKESDTYKL